MVTFNTHIIDQTVKDKFHPFITKAVEPMIPIHYEKITVTDKNIIVDMIAQEHLTNSWNDVSKRMLIVGELSNGQLKLTSKKQINNMNYRAPLPCSDSNSNCYTESQCQWSNRFHPLTDGRKMVVPKESGKPIEEIKYEQRSYDDLRHRDPYCKL